MIGNASTVFSKNIQQRSFSLTGTFEEIRMEPISVIYMIWTNDNAPNTNLVFKLPTPASRMEGRNMSIKPIMVAGATEKASSIPSNCR